MDSFPGAMAAKQPKRSNAIKLSWKTRPEDEPDFVPLPRAWMMELIYLWPISVENETSEPEAEMRNSVLIVSYCTF
jgi:hypothetical protein